MLGLLLTLHCEGQPSLLEQTSLTQPQAQPHALLTAVPFQATALMGVEVARVMDLVVLTALSVVAVVVVKPVRQPQPQAKTLCLLDTQSGMASG